jgi:hypothetical protein
MMPAKPVRRAIDAHTDTILKTLARYPDPMSSRHLAEACLRSEIWVRTLRMEGGGPAFHRLGRSCVYYHADVAAWLAERRFLRTSDYAPPAKPKTDRRTLPPE